MTVESKFDRDAETYDADRRRLIPCFGGFYGSVISEVGSLGMSEPRVLDLGAGTGLLSRLIVEQFPGTKIHLVDVSSKMLDIASSSPVLQQNIESVSVINLNEIKALNGQFDAIVSSLAIHHLSGPEKQNLFNALPSLLVENGVFLNADQVLGETPEIEACYRSTWLRQVKEAGVSKHALAAALDRMKEDKMDTLADQLAWLRDAGFSSADCVFQDFSFTVVRASL